jgi:hypothetical protein
MSPTEFTRQLMAHLAKNCRMTLSVPVLLRVTQPEEQQKR